MRVSEEGGKVDRIHEENVICDILILHFHIFLALVVVYASSCFLFLSIVVDSQIKLQF